MINDRLFRGGRLFYCSNMESWRFTLSMPLMCFSRVMSCDRCSVLSMSTVIRPSKIPSAELMDMARMEVCESFAINSVTLLIMPTSSLPVRVNTV